jgi:hypothetical protein
MVCKEGRARRAVRRAERAGFRGALGGGGISERRRAVKMSAKLTI